MDAGCGNLGEYRGIAEWRNGRRATFRAWCLRAWRFESSLGYQKTMTRLYDTPGGYLTEGQLEEFIGECFEKQTPEEKIAIKLRYGDDLFTWYDSWSRGKFNSKEKFFRKNG